MMIQLRQGLSNMMGSSVRCPFATGMLVAARPPAHTLDRAARRPAGATVQLLHMLLVLHTALSARCIISCQRL
jgi:hypothetical protein